MSKAYILFYESTATELETVKDRIHAEGGEFGHFCVGDRGRARYHWMTIANNSCGIYYAWRDFGCEGVGCRRALEPTRKIRVYFNPASVCNHASACQ